MVRIDGRQLTRPVYFTATNCSLGTLTTPCQYQISTLVLPSSNLYSMLKVLQSTEFKLVIWFSMVYIEQSIVDNALSATALNSLLETYMYNGLLIITTCRTNQEVAYSQSCHKYTREEKGKSKWFDFAIQFSKMLTSVLVLNMNIVQLKLLPYNAIYKRRA